jgi:hypothetical protein
MAAIVNHFRIFLLAGVSISNRANVRWPRTENASRTASSSSTPIKSSPDSWLTIASRTHLMRTYPLTVVILAVALTSTCAKRVPERVGVPPGTPHISWVLMHGDRDNPDSDFACQSEPRTECVIPASRPDAQVFSDIHFYYHGAAAETRYEGTINFGYLQGSPDSHTSRINIAVQKNKSITNSSVTGIVTSTPGTHAVTISLTATVTDTRKTQAIRESIPVVVK